jgi:hypothetical protein
VTENENEDENEKNEKNENENDEIKNKQHCRKRLNKYTKTNDAKNEDAVNRLRFMKLKS